MHRLTTCAAAMLMALTLTACDGADEPTIVTGELEATPDVVATPTEAEPTPTEAPAPSPSESMGAAATEEPDETAPPTFEEVCEGRDDEAFIEVLTPMADSEVDGTFTVTGCGNTFEANYLFRVEASDGEVLAEGFGTMTCGNGCVGEFEQEIEVNATGAVTLVVFESSAEDGSEQHVVEVPLTIG